MDARVYCTNLYESIKATKDNTESESERSKLYSCILFCSYWGHVDLERLTWAKR